MIWANSKDCMYSTWANPRDIGRLDQVQHGCEKNLNQQLSNGIQEFICKRWQCYSFHLHLCRRWNIFFAKKFNNFCLHTKQARKARRCDSYLQIWNYVTVIYLHLWWSCWVFSVLSFQWDGCREGVLQPDLHQQWGSRINICRRLLLQWGQVKTTILTVCDKDNNNYIPYFRCNVPAMPDPTEAPGPDNTTSCPGLPFFAFSRFVNPDEKYIILQSVWNDTIVLIWRH